ncbi:unnamed protein product [Urochloa decumbens]|uniref:DUF1618 domain-containing protein n=1 Tax=Urochloa decumbens TaxID=240449 RepID=A0ABC9FD04_9POAL
MDIAAAGAGCEWVLLDPRAVTGGFGSGSAAPSPTAAASVASNGRVVRVSLHLEPPPAVSYVEVASGDPFTGNPTVAAADGDLLLVDMGFYYSAGEEHDESRIRTHHADDLFVYKADPERPSLRRLPARPGRHTGGGLHAGIVRVRGGGGDGEFLVADLQTRVENLEGGCWCYVTELLRYSSVADRWEVRRLDMPDEEECAGVVLRASTWVTNAAFSSGGIVSVPVSGGVGPICQRQAGRTTTAASSPETSPPPPTTPSSGSYGNRMYPERHRRASVNGGGVLWFVDVDDSRYKYESYGEWGRVQITTWSLRTPPELGWEKEHTLVLDDDAVLPPVLVGEEEEEEEDRVWVTPTFPVVSVQEDGVVHAVVWVGWDCWMATVDMRSGSFRSRDMLQKKAGPEESDGDATEIRSIT